MDRRVRFTVVVDGETTLSQHAQIPPFVNIMHVPHSYKPNHAAYKARVLECFRIRTNLCQEDWVLHLDEETQIDDHLMQAVLNFIE